MRVLFVGDIYGSPGREYFMEKIDEVRKEEKINLVIVNAENANHGRGITKKIYKELMEKGVSSITMGNHTWGNKEIFELLDDANIVVPANYPEAPGKKYITINYNGKTLTVINLLGRVYMNNMTLDCPFKKAKEIIDSVKSDYYLIDFHAEATSEKIAFGQYLDGMATAIVGTHTHVQTADDRVLPNGTLYITDVGMTGPYDGVIGVKSSVILNKFTKGTYEPNDTAAGKRQMSAVVLDFTKKTIKRILIHE